MGAIRNRTDMFATALAEAMIRWRWIVILATILATVGFAMGMPRLAFDTNYRAFFSDENPEQLPGLLLGREPGTVRLRDLPGDLHQER